MLVKHLIRELMKCDLNSKVTFELDYESAEGSTCAIVKSKYSNNTVIIRSDRCCEGVCNYNNTHDTPFPLSEKE